MFEEPVAAVSDQEVLESFKDMVNPISEAPLYLQYLQLDQMMAQIGDCLFLHGGIHRDGIGFVPNRPQCTTLPEWIRSLNQWADDEISSFVQNPYYNADGTRAGDDLLEYTAPW